MADEIAVFNHFGHCVTDLERSVRFYCELFGFAEKKRNTIPDQPADRLLRIEAPLGMNVAYLVKDSTTLELIAFERPANPPARRRPFNEPGLTHMSFCVADLAAARSQVVALGGEVLEDTDVGAAVFVTDPDGQLLELIALEYRSMLA